MRVVMGAAAVVVLAAACTSDDPGLDGTFPVSYDSSQITEDLTLREGWGGATLLAHYYVNQAYRCGRTGYASFVVVENETLVGMEAPLWVLLHGGAVTYYGAAGAWRGPVGPTDAPREDLLDEESPDALVSVLMNHLTTATGGLKSTVVSRRLRDGYRMLVLSLCDQDFYAGMGRADADNPNYTGAAYEGLLASMSAIDFVANGNSTFSGYGTGRIFVHGQSAGAVGAWAVAHAFARGGVTLNGVLMDGLMWTERNAAIRDQGCVDVIEPPAPMPADRQVFADRVGPFLSDARLFVDNNIAGPDDVVPILDVQATQDARCCGNVPALPEALAAGYDNNCSFVHGGFTEAIAALPPGAKHRQILRDMPGHTITDVEGPHQDPLDRWLFNILLYNPPPPSF